MSNRILQKVKQFLQKHSLQNSELLVGFSGGIDSTALLLALHLLQKNIRAVHFQHGIRGKTAEAEANWCRAFCHKKNIPFTCIHLAVPENVLPGETLEEAARRLRLENWHKLCAHSSKPIFLGHHADDCLEELLIRLARGSNSSGLTGLRPIRQLGELILYRPLLSFPKKELEAFLFAEGVTEHCYDASNIDNQFRRNAVRNIILPEFERVFGTLKGMRQAQRTLLQDAYYLEELAEKSMQGIETLDSWRALPAALFPRVLRLWFNKNAGFDMPPSAKLCRRLQATLDSEISRELIVPINAKYNILVNKQGLKLQKIKEFPTETKQWNWKEQNLLLLPEINSFFLVKTGDKMDKAPGKIITEETFDLETFPEILQQRYWLPGDRMIPFAAKSSKKLQDLFSDKKIPRSKRHKMPLLLSNNEIIWIPNLRRAEFCRTVAGRKVITIQFGVFK